MSKDFSDEEVRQFNENYWQDMETALGNHDRVICPRDRGKVTVLVSDEIGAPYSMSAHCDRCGASASFRSAPGRGDALSEDEIQSVVEMHQASQTARCPQDNTPMKVRENRALGGKLTYKFDCPRFGASGKQTVR